MLSPVAAVLAEHPWLAACAAIAGQQGFFHWELTFGTAFGRNGGFDLQVGNPPWFRPTVDMSLLMAEGDPWWQLTSRADPGLSDARTGQTLAIPGVREYVTNSAADLCVTLGFIGSPQNFPDLQGLQPDLYRCFMEATWRRSARSGLVALIHAESHFTDEAAGRLRAASYRRLRRHFQFINELKLFDIPNIIRYGVNVYGCAQDRVSFLNAVSGLLGTVLRSLAHDGSGSEPGIKDEEDNWDVRPHAGRLARITNQTLDVWCHLLEVEDVSSIETRMVYAVNRAASVVLECLRPSHGLAGCRGRARLGGTRPWTGSAD